MTEQDSDCALLTEIAVAYYDQEQTQEEIAKRFGISRIKVGRLKSSPRRDCRDQRKIPPGLQLPD